MIRKNTALWLPYFAIFLLWLLYQIITFAAPVSASSVSLGLSAQSIRLLQLTISLPLLATWLIGIWGADNLSRFSRSLENVDQKIAFHHTSKGVRILIFGSMLTSLLGSIRTYYALSPEIVRLFTILINYLYVIPTLYGLILFHSSARSLARSVKAEKLSFIQSIFSLLLPLSISLLYSWFILTNPTRTFSNIPGVNPTYYLSDLLIFLTLVVPLAASWVFGTLSVLYTHQYHTNVSGTVFRTSTGQLTWGKTLIVFASMFIQLILSLGNSRLLGQGLTIVLAIIYAFVLIQAIGYLLVGLGSRKLKNIETVLEKYITK